MLWMTARSVWLGVDTLTLQHASARAHALDDGAQRVVGREVQVVQLGVGQRARVVALQPALDGPALVGMPCAPVRALASPSCSDNLVPGPGIHRTSALLSLFQ